LILVPDTFSAPLFSPTFSALLFRSFGRHGNRGRDAAIGLARELVEDPLETFAEHFGGVSRSAITETARRARQRAEREPAFAALLDEIRRELRR
jgi:hypothetical protein